MKLQLSKFGNILTSRQDGREAFGAVNSQLLNLDKDEKIEIDFEGVGTLTPSWADEFITKIAEARKVLFVEEKTDDLQQYGLDNPTFIINLKLIE